MKNLIVLMTLALLCGACASSIDYDAEKTAITKLLDDESKFAAAADSASWAACWVTTEANPFTFTAADGISGYSDFNALATAISEAEPFDLKLTRDNYNFVIGQESAFVSFDQQDNWGGTGERKTRETRTLKKVNGQWKIASVNVVDVSSFEAPPSESFHMAGDQIPPNPKSGFTNINGIGGMSIGYLDIPEPMDFTPLFAGLPQDLCSSPHWGYIIDGSIRIKYADGKEETVKAGEVFYWPAPHTGIIDDHVKLVDFSPDGKFIPLMDHIAAKMAEQQ